MRTSFTDLFGCEVPLQLAPMGGVGTPELAAAVTGAGRMGMLATVLAPASAVAAMLDDVARRAEGPFGLNFLLLAEPDPAAVEAAAARCAYVDFYHGEVDARLVDLVHRGGALAGWQVNSVGQARAAEDAGCEVVVVRGVEGGGRMYGHRALRPLLDEVAGAVEVPVVAAGGLSTGRDIVDCLEAGASAVRMGTMFVATEESGAHPVYKQALVAAEASDVTVTDEFSVGLPASSRAGVLTSALERAREADGRVIGETVVGGRTVPVEPLAPFPPVRETAGDIAAMALYAGTSVRGVTGIEPAGALVRRLAAEVSSLLAG